MFKRIALLACFFLPLCAVKAQSPVAPYCVSSISSTGQALYAPCSSANVDTLPVAQQATPANSSHAAGVSVGGLFTFPFLRAAGTTGGITEIWIKSAGGYTGGYYVYLWNKKPASTCTDNSAFSFSASDATHLIAAPILLTPSVGATNDTASYVQTNGFYLPVQNADTTPTTVNVYGCLIAAATDTADQNAVVTFSLEGTSNP